MAKNNYTPIEKNVKMFGKESDGYTKERVDTYLSQLETAYISLKDKYKNASQQPQPMQQPQPAVQVQDLAKIQQEYTAMRNEAQRLQQENEFLKAKFDELRQKVKQAIPVQDNSPEQKDLIAQTMLDARKSAAQILQSAQNKADALLGNAYRKKEEIEADELRVKSQLRSINKTINHMLQTDSEDEWGDEYVE